MRLRSGADPDAGLIEQGATTSVRETLTAKHREIGPMPPMRPPPPPDPDAPVVVVEKIETPGTVNFELPPQRYYTIVRRQRQPQPARTVCGTDSGGAARAADAAGKSRRRLHGRRDLAELAGAAGRHRVTVPVGLQPGATVQPVQRPCTTAAPVAPIAPVAPVAPMCRSIARPKAPSSCSPMSKPKIRRMCSWRWSPRSQPAQAEAAARATAAANATVRLQRV